MSAAWIGCVHGSTMEITEKFGFFRTNVELGPFTLFRQTLCTHIHLLSYRLHHPSHWPKSNPNDAFYGVEIILVPVICNKKVRIPGISCYRLPVLYMMTSSNGNIFRVTGPLCGEFTGDRWIPLAKASDAELDVFFDRRLNKRLSKQSWGWWV